MSGIIERITDAQIALQYGKERTYKLGGDDLGSDDKFHRDLEQSQTRFREFGVIEAFEEIEEEFLGEVGTAIDEFTIYSTSKETLGTESQQSPIFEGVFARLRWVMEDGSIRFLIAGFSPKSMSVWGGRMSIDEAFKPEYSYLPLMRGVSYIENLSHAQTQALLEVKITDTFLKVSL